MTDLPKNIIGSGGGGQKKAPEPTIAKDTLHSRQFGTFLDLFSEGEIEGFATASKEGRTQHTNTYNKAALKDVFLNDTPVLRASANSASTKSTDFNFQDVKFIPRFGTANQSKIKGILSNAATIGVNAVVKKDTPVIRQIQATTQEETNIDRIKVTITVPSLQHAKKNGDIEGSKVRLKIALSYNSGGYSTKIDDTIKGRTADAYQKQYSININNGIFKDPGDTVDIKVSRVTKDSTSSSLQNEFQWTSFTTIVDSNNKYPNSAYASLRLDSMSFGSIPTRKYRIRGIKVRIP